MNTMHIFGVLTIGFMALHLGTALNCYSCDSSKGINCNYGLLSFTYSTAECKANTGSSFFDSVANIIPSNCIKLVGIAKDGSEYVARSCAPSTGPINSCDIIAKAINFAERDELDQLDCYTCDTDKCNTGSRHSVATLSIVGLMLACVAFVL